MFFGTWSRQDRHRFYGGAQPCRNQADVFYSQKHYCAKPTKETTIHRFTKFAQGILISAAPTLQNLRICVRKRRNDKSMELAKQRGGWQRNSEVKGETENDIFLPTVKWCLPSPSKIKPEEREFVVDSAASMHMISRKDFNSAELETVTTSRCPTTVITANAEVQTHEEARVHADLFLSVKILEDTPAVLSLGKLCEDHGYSQGWTNGQKTCLFKKWCSDTM